MTDTNQNPTASEQVTMSLDTSSELPRFQVRRLESLEYLGTITKLEDPHSSESWEAVDAEGNSLGIAVSMEHAIGKLLS